ncbi:MAG: hypothetical protein WKF66_16980 [Pedobacter sp.]
MHLYKSIVIIFICFLTGCSSSPLFDRQVWIDNPDEGDRSNPRARMVDDVVKTHLKPGMSKTAVLKLLGKPLYEGIESRLPKNRVIPDSITYADGDASKPEITTKKTNALNNFYRLYAEPVMILRYPVGWSTIDPNYLIVKLSEKGLVQEFWVEQG